MGFAPDIPGCCTGLREDEIGARKEDRPWAQGGVTEEGWEEIGPLVSTFQRGGQEGQTFIHPVIDTAVIVSKLLVTMRDTKELWDLPLVFLVLLLLRFSEWWLRRKWGIV